MKRPAFFALLQVVLALGIVSVRGADSSLWRTQRVVATPVPTPTLRPPPPLVKPAAPTDPLAVLAQKVGAELGGKATCLVVRDGKRTIVSHRPAMPLVPASTQKVLVAAAALEALGPDFRFGTKVLAHPESEEARELWLVGSGDPGLATPEYEAWVRAHKRWHVLATTPLDALAEKIASAGIRSVGVIHGDDDHHDRSRYIASWRESYIKDADATPMSALSLNGGLRAWDPRREPVGEPASHAAAELGRLLAARGVTVAATDAAPAPAGGVSEVAAVSSAPLVDVVGGMLRSSHNPTAELLTRELGDGVTQQGAGEVVNRLRGLGVDTEGVGLVDGSGLDGGNRATCRALIDTIDASKLVDRLPVAGQAGTLIARKAWAGRLRAKTGWIRGTVGLVGVFEAGRPLRFALLQNGVPNLPAGHATEDRILQALDSYARGA